MLASLEGFLEEADFPEAVLNERQTALGGNVASPSGSCPLPPPGIRYNATMDERRYTPRAHLDEGGDRYTNRAVLLSSGQEHCDRISFHVLVSLTPCSPAGRTQVPTGRGHGAGMGVLPQESQGAQLVPADLGGAASGQCPRPWPPPTQAPEKRPLGHSTYH